MASPLILAPRLFGNEPPSEFVFFLSFLTVRAGLRVDVAAPVPLAPRVDFCWLVLLSARRYFLFCPDSFLTDGLTAVDESRLSSDDTRWNGKGDAEVVGGALCSSRGCGWLEVGEGEGGCNGFLGPDIEESGCWCCCCLCVCIKNGGEHVNST